ncbi:MAG: hydrolase [Sneathiella sp.]
MSHLAFLSWIEDQHASMLETVLQWSHINCGSENLDGLEKMATVLKDAFMTTGGEVSLLPSKPMTVVDEFGIPKQVPLGQVLRVTKRPDANRQILLCGHMDTVFSQESPFQSCTDIGDGMIQGPGVTDMKGGLNVMLTALRAFEMSPHKDQIGWEVLINADEEIGSFGSRHYLVDSATRADIGLVYEPSLPDGTLAGPRKGSGNFTLVLKGRAAHAGREHHLGRNAIAALSRAVIAIDALTGGRPELTINIGRIDGGGALNVVPDLAICRFNVRVKEPEDQMWLQNALEEIVDHANSEDGYTAKLHGGFSRPPKPMTPSLQQLFDLLKICGTELDIPIQYKPTGGCCDGNNLAAAGLPNIDTLGVRGANIHSDKEYIITQSLTERAKLTALILHKLASGDASFPIKGEIR